MHAKTLLCISTGRKISPSAIFSRRQNQDHLPGANRRLPAFQASPDVLGFCRSMQLCAALSGTLHDLANLLRALFYEHADSFHAGGKRCRDRPDPFLVDLARTLLVKHEAHRVRAGFDRDQFVLEIR